MLKNKRPIFIGILFLTLILLGELVLLSSKKFGMNFFSKNINAKVKLHYKSGLSATWDRLPLDSEGVFLTGVFVKIPEINGNQRVAFTAVVDGHILSRNGHQLLPLVMNSSGGPKHIFLDIGEWKHIGLYTVPLGIWGNSSFPISDLTQSDVATKLKSGAQILIVLAGTSPNIPLSAPDRNTAIKLAVEFGKINEQLTQTPLKDGQILHLPMSVAVAINQP